MLRISICALLAWSAFAQNALEQAVTLTRAKRYVEARQALTGVAEPGDVRRRIAFHRLKAAIASGLGEAAPAAAEMRLALELAPGDPAVSLATATAELQASELDRAAEHAHAAGNSAAAQELIAEIEEKRGNFVEAAKAYQAAVALAPDREEYRIALALELIEHQTFAPAIAVLEQSAPLFPKSARMRCLLGIARFANGDISSAIDALVEAVRLDPKLDPAHIYLSQIVLDSSAAPGQAALDALCDWNTTVCSALKLRVAREKDDAALFDEAMGGLKRASSDNVLARCELARGYEWKGRWSEARSQAEACVRIDPSPQNHFRLGRIYSQLGMAEPARREMEEYRQGLRKVTDETARRLSVIQGFQYTFRR